VTEITYDPDADATYVTLSGAVVQESAEILPGVVFDYDSAGRLIGIELLDARSRLAPGAWSRAPRPAPPRRTPAAE